MNSRTAYNSLTTREKIGELMADGQGPDYPLTLLTIYRFKYVHPSQLPRILPNHYGSKPTAYRHLAMLRKNGLLSPANKERNRNDLLAYHTSNLARRYLHDSQNEVKIIQSRHETTKLWRLQHELDISEFQADVTCWLHQRSDLEMGSMERRYFHKHNHMIYDYEDGNKPLRLEPDLGLLIHLPKDGVKFPFMYFIEVDRGSENMRTIRQKVTQFQSWYELTGKEDLMTLFREGGLAKPKPRYTLLFITRDRRGNDFRQLARLAVHIRGVVPRPPVMITTYQLLDSHREAQSNDPAIWYPVNEIPLDDDASYDDVELYLSQSQPVRLLPKKEPPQNGGREHFIYDSKSAS